jgi:hypothetical protein
LDTDTGEVVEKTLKHEGEKVRQFYSALAGPRLWLFPTARWWLFIT